MGLLGRKDSIQEFSEMRRVLKRAEKTVRKIPAESERIEDAVPEKVEPSIEARPMPSVTADRAATIPLDYASTVSQGTVWQGNLKIDGSVWVEGKMSGEIDARDALYVAEGADVDATVHAAIVIVAGSFEGQIDCTDRLEILSTGRMKAAFTTKSLVVHEGAVIDGEIRMTEGQTAGRVQLTGPVNRIIGPEAKPGETTALTVAKPG